MSATEWRGPSHEQEALAMQAVGSLALAFGEGMAALAAGCMLFGLGVGNLTSLPPLIAQREFRPADVGTVMALVTAVNQAIFGWLHDRTANYVPLSGLRQQRRSRRRRSSWPVGGFPSRIKGL